MRIEKTLHDDALTERYYSTGNTEYLGLLYSRYTHMVYGVCMKYLQNREEAKDAVIHIFEKLVHEMKKQEIKVFGKWLYVISKNYCLMQIRAGKTVQKHQKNWVAEQELIMESGEFVHPLDANEADTDKKLQECIERLVTEQKKCIEMFYFENKCYREIADLLTMDEKKVKSYLQNGKRNLKICMEGKNVR